MRFIAITAALLISTGCNAFYDDTTSTSVASYGFEVRTFDDSLPDAIEYLFWDCRDPLVLSEGQEDLDLLGNCEPWNYSQGSPVRALATVLAAGAGELNQPISLSSVGEPSLQTFGFWGAQCSVEITPSVTVEDIALYDLSASWTTRHNKAALGMDFDFDEGIQAEMSFSRSPVTCTRSWMNRYARSVLDQVINGTYSVELSNPDLDVWFKFSRELQTSISVGSGSVGSFGTLDVSVEARMNIGTIQTGTVLDALPGDLKTSLLQNAGFRAWRHENNIEVGVEDALQGIAYALEDQADADLEDICSVEVVAGEFVIQSDEDCVSNAVIPNRPYRAR